MRHLRLIRVALVVSIAALASQTFAQVWPAPSSQQGTPTICSACPVPEKDKPTWPYNDPLQTFTGRYLDSLYVQDWQQMFRTARAGQVLVMPSLNRVYLQIGHAVGAYNMGTFFSRLENREPLMKATSYPGNFGWRKGWQDEIWLRWDVHFYAENGGSGWQTPTIDGQDRLVRFDVDDRGYVYMAYTVFGWGIAKDNGGTGGGLMDSVYQDFPHPAFAPNQIVVLKNGAGRYFAYVGGPNAGSMEVYDVTDPAHPVRQRDYPQGFIEAGKGNSVLAAVSNDNRLSLYDIDTATAGGGALLTATGPNGASYMAVTSDGTNFYALYKTPAVTLGISSFVRQANGTFTRTDYPMGNGTFDGRIIKYGDGYLSVSGWHAGGDLRLFKLNGTVPVEIDTQEFFFKYYAGPPSGYARPPIAAPAGPVTVKYNNKIYLILPAFGLGDVWQLKADDLVSVVAQGATGVVNPNADARVEKEVFYGDNVGFTAASNKQMSLTWNFGNPEATGDPNSTTSGVGAVIRHQYSGLTPATLGGARQVTATDQNNAVSSTTITLKAPTARFGVSGTSLRITAPEANSTAPIVYGDKFFDASPGDIEGHYVRWNIDGAVTTTQPYTVTGQHLVPVGACGAHTLNFDAFYGPYNLNTFTTIGPNYQVGIHGPSYDFNYKVLPFAAAINAPSANASNVTFTSASRATTDTSVLLPHPQALSWQWDLVDAQENVVLAGTAGYAANAAGIPGWSAPKTAFNTRNLRARLVLASTQALGAACAGYTVSRASTAALNGPDPVINGGCTNGGAPCSFSVASGSGVNTATDGWTYSWSVNPAGPVSAPTANLATFAPSFSQVGLYTVSVTVSNAIGTQTITKNVNVTQATPLCGAMNANTLFIHYTGPSSNCSEYGGNCTPQESVSFSVKPFGYDFSCAPHTFQWSFGDGSTASGINATHKYAVAGNYNVTCVINNGGAPYTAAQTVSVGGGTIITPTCATMSDSNLFVSYAGAASSCSQTGGNCSAGENVVFSVGAFGYDFNCYPNHSFIWNFGDQTAGVGGKTVSHSFNKAGTYNVSVSIFNGAQTFVATRSVTVTGTTVTPNNCPPMNANNIFISFHNASNSCNELNNRCPKNDGLELTAKTFGYSFSCADHTFHWNFGDGAQADGLTVTHTFADAKTYNVQLTIANPGQSFVAQQSIVVGGPDIPGRIVPEVSFDATGTESVPKLITFMPKVEPAGTIIKWSWDFGDGQKVVATGGAEQIHRYDDFGAYLVTLTVEDSQGPVKTYTREVIVQPPHRRAKK